MGSLRDQLVKSGLVTKEKADLAAAKSRKKAKGKRRADNPNAALIEREAAQKKARDKHLNAEREAKRQAEARRAAVKQQIKRLIDDHAIADFRGEVAYNYQAGRRVKQVFVKQEVHEKLAAGDLGITRLDGKTFLVPAGAAEKILELNPDWMVWLVRPEEPREADPDDPYAGYEVPDDLIW